VTSSTEDKRPIIRLKNIGLAYSIRAGFRNRSEVWALKDISFDLFKGDSLGVIGGNGMGKTTLLKVLAGIISPDRGVIEATGCQTTLLSLALGFAPNLSGRENILLSGMMMGLDRQVIEGKMEGIIEFSELGESIDRPVSTYSSGMKLRLGFAVAIEAEGDVLLIDEVLGVGDKAFQAKSSKVLHEMIQSDRTVVIVSHSVATIRSLCDRVVWIHQGESICAGDTESILARFEEESAGRTAKR